MCRFQSLPCRGLVTPRYLESSWSRNWTCVLCIGKFLTTGPPGKSVYSSFEQFDYDVPWCGFFFPPLFLVLGVCWGSWICRSIIFIIYSFGHYFFIYFFFCALHLLSLRDSSYLYTGCFKLSSSPLERLLFFYFCLILVNFYDYSSGSLVFFFPLIIESALIIIPCVFKHHYWDIFHIP